MKGLMDSPSLDVLVISDLHYASGGATVGERHVSLGPVLLDKCVARLRHEGIQPDVLVLAGDQIDEGAVAQADADMVALVVAAKRAGLPVLAVPGNHDNDGDRVARMFGCRPGLHEIGGYGFLVFHDAVAEDNTMTRSPEALRLPEQAAREHPGLPLVALQHYLLRQPADHTYPFALTNADNVTAAYRQAGVCLSISGHFHRGQELHCVDGVPCFTAPSVAETPFRFTLLRLKGKEVEVCPYALRMDQGGLTDVHCHTEFAYCASTVTAERAIEISRIMGLNRLCFSEHAFQLYFTSEDAWSWRWQHDTQMLDEAVRNGGGRMPEYRRATKALRSDFVRTGLEVDLRKDGSLLLADEDRKGWDLLIGSVHTIPDLHATHTTQASVERLFMRDTERLLQHPINVLAHPFRFFRRAGLKQPVHLYGEVADMLAARSVAAEINFHTNNPDPRFAAECLARGAKIALARVS